MIELQYIHPSEIQPSDAPLSPLANAFDYALMQVDINGCSTNDEAGEVEIAIADALAEYCLIGLTPQLIIKRLLDYI